MINQNKMTAVEWLEEQLKFCAISNFDYAVHHTEILISTQEFESLFKQAKEMEKEQIKDAWNDVYGHIKDADEYYNETFKSE